MTTWRENLKKLPPYIDIKHPSNIKLLENFISLTLKEALDEVEGNLPEEQKIEEDFIKSNLGYDSAKGMGFNSCLAEVKESIKKTKEKYLK